MTDELKAMLKAAKTEEEAKEILLAEKRELSDEELEKINGGGVQAVMCGATYVGKYNSSCPKGCL